MPYLACITIFPIKALDGVPLVEAALLPSGGLQHDRQFAFLDQDGNFINGKRNPKVHLLRAAFYPDLQEVLLGVRGQEPSSRFHLGEDRHRMNEWLSTFFGLSVFVHENQAGGFPDDTDAPAPTFISTATLESVASWFPPLTVEEMRTRLRANLEIGGVEPFWEDRLFAEQGRVVRFQVGRVYFEGTNPCQRCVVPTRNPETGEATPGFQKTFAQKRQATLPAWASASRFNHFYRLAVNTRPVPGQGVSTIKVGDEVRILETP